jgi:hypothetical protein
MNYLDFKISVEHINGQEYRISVSSENGGEYQETTTFPFDDTTLTEKLTSIRKVLHTTGTRAIGRRLDHTSEKKNWTLDDIEDFGTELFGFLFPSEILGQYRNVAVVAASLQNKGVRLKLRFAESASSLSPIPWEFLYDKARRDFISLDHESALVRYLDLPRPVEALVVSQPLKILGMVSNPLNDLDVEREKRLVEDSLASLISNGRIELGWLKGDTFRDIQSEMRRGDWHVFHYIGHAGFDDQRDEGFLLLGDGRGGSMNLYAKDLSRLIRIEKLRLVLLNACDGAASDSQDLFSSTASILVSDGMPAVLAMQYPITDTAAIELARTFYESVSDGLPVDYALADARINIKISHGDSLEWATPVLFMRSKDGRLFEVAGSEAPASTGVQPSATLQNNEPVAPVVTATNTVFVDRLQIGKFLDDHFNISELKGVCDGIDVDPEDLGYSGKKGLVRELVKYLLRRNKADQLLTYLSNDPEHRELLVADFGPFGSIEYTDKPSPPKLGG